MLKKYDIKGKANLKGRVTISGSKNAALPIFAATLLTDEPVKLHNVPYLRDTVTMTRLLEKLGKKVEYEGSTVTITAGEPLKQPIRAMYEIVKQMRASICVLGPLLTRHGHVEVALPGGCVFGPRPVDLHLRGLSMLGANIEIRHGDIVAEASGRSSGYYLQGAKINLRGKFGTSVLATDNVLSAAVLAKGSTLIEGAAQEPETQDLIGLLQAMGAKIELRVEKGQGVIAVEGVERLRGAEYTIIPDRIEAGTYMIFSGLTESSLVLENVALEHLQAPMELLRSIGIQYELEEEAAKKSSTVINCSTPLSNVKLTARPLTDYKPFTLRTGTYPEFPTDLQPLFMTLATVIPGTSYIYDTIYPNRFNHAPELARMGADIAVTGNCAEIKGVKSLESARVQASDLRAGAALVGAALSTHGASEIKRIYHIERGYENLVGKLNELGAEITLAEDSIV